MSTVHDFTVIGWIEKRMPLQKEFQLIVKHILCIYGFFLAVLNSTSMPFSVMKCPIARNLMYESMFFFLLCIAGSNKIWQVWRRGGHGFNFFRRLSIDSETWKANKRFIMLHFFFSWRTKSSERKTKLVVLEKFGLPTWGSNPRLWD